MANYILLDSLHNHTFLIIEERENMFVLGKVSDHSDHNCP